MWKCTVLLLLALASTVNSNETPPPRQCAVCLEKDCATGVREIYPAGSITTVWVKANSSTGIQNCSMENLKADAPCKMANDSLVQLANKMLRFEGMDTCDVRCKFRSQISPCADLNLPPKPSPVTKTPIHNTPTPAAPNISVADKKGIIIIIFISIGVLIGKCCSHGEAQVKLTNRIVREREVSSRKRKKMEYRPTEGGPRNTLASFHLQFIALLLLLAPSVNSTEAPKPGMCAVCLDKDCATLVEGIYPAGSITTVWVKANSPTGIQNCSMENLKADAPCKMANGSLVQLANEMLHFEEMNPRGVRRVFDSQISSCADLNLPPSSTPSPVTKAPNISVADNKGIIIGIIIGSIGIVFCIFILIRCLIRKCCIRLDGQYRGLLQESSGVPSPGRDEISIQIQPPNAEVPNENVNGVHREDDSVGTAG